MKGTFRFIRAAIPQMLAAGRRLDPEYLTVAGLKAILRL